MKSTPGNSPHPTPAEGTPETDKYELELGFEHGGKITAVDKFVASSVARSLETRLINTQSRLEEAERLLGRTVLFVPDTCAQLQAEVAAHLARHQTSGGSKP